MPRIETVVQSPIHSSFRVQQVAGMFDLPLGETSRNEFVVDLPGLDEQWAIGAIVGPSGSGKSTVAREAFVDGHIASNCMVNQFDWPHDKAIVDGFDSSLSGRHITGMLNAVGLSSPPVWVKPYRVLSNGQQFRCDLARALLSESPIVAFDEFTSVVDRQAARFGSAAVANAVRKGKARCSRFVAVTCHYDILDWLSPDWHLDMADGTLHWGSVQRPAIDIEIRHAKRNRWATYRSHHYLSSALNPAARCYEAWWDDQPIAFCATIPLFGQRGRRIIHRLVVLPDFQGLGVGQTLLDHVAELESKTRTISIVTSHPALVHRLAKSKQWRCVRVVKCGLPHSGVKRSKGKTIGSVGRMTASFRYLSKTTNQNGETNDRLN